MRPLNIAKYLFSAIILFSLLNSKSIAAAPTDIILSSDTISENLPDSSLVGVLSTVDPDGDLVFTYSLVPGIGSGDNASFVIKDDTLFSHEIFDYETKSTYSVRIRTSDGVDTYEKVFAITINDVNEAPTDIILSASAIAENLPVNSVVGTFSTTDPDGDVSFTYSLVSGTGSNDNGSFNISGNQLRTSAVFNFEAKSSYTIRVQSSDGGLTYQKVFNIAVTDVNEAPTDIALSSDQVPENQPINTIVGTLSSVDPDGDMSFTYTLVPGVGSSDNGSFNISGNQLRTNEVLDADTKPTCQIRIRSTDGGGLYREEAFTITVTNINEPPVLSGIEGIPLAYTEDDPATYITSTIVVSDPENGNMTGATVSITGGFNADEDRLSLMSSLFTVTIDNANGILTISGTGTITQYQNTLRSVRYVNINDRDPSETDRTIQFVIYDGTYNSAPVTRTIQITGVNDPPDVQDDSYGGVLEGGTLIVNVTNGVLNNDEDLDGPVAMTAHLIDDVQFGSLSLNSNGSFTYVHGGTSDLVDGFTYYAYDSEYNSLPATVTITMVGTNDPPVLSGIESTILSYNEDDPPRQITATILVSDEDNPTLQSAVFRIDNNFISTEDSLVYTSNASLTISYIPATGIINVTGEASLLIYQNFLRSIRYINTNNLNPSVAIRRATFTVNDGTNNSVPVYRYIQIVPQNDPPVATNADIIGSDFYIGQLLTADYTFSDPDGDMEGNTTFRWYMADDDQGTGRTPINTSQKDTITPVFEQGGKWMQVVVRPFDINGLEGIYDTSEFRYINAAPVLNDFTIINEIHPGAFALDEIVRADYTYFDVESDPPGTHTFQWYRSNTGSWTDAHVISGADSYIYTIADPDNNKYIALEATPIATAGSSPGQVQQSEWHLVSAAPSAVISGNIDMCEGSTDFLTVTLTGSNPPWSFRYVIEGTTDTIPVSDIPASNSDYPLEVSDSGTYILVDISDQVFDFGTVIGTGSVSFYPQPTAELTVDELSICDNDVGIYTMPVQLSGTAPWSVSYKIIGQPDSSYFSIDTPEAEIEFTVDDLGTYQLLHVWDANCMASGTGTTNVILRENPRASMTGDATVCPGDSTQITVDLSGVGPWTFYYTVDNGDETAVDINQSGPSFEHIFKVAQAGTYRLTRVENAIEEGCAYGTAVIENYPMPSATITGDITICEGSSTDIPVTLEGTSPWTITYVHNIDDPVVLGPVTQNPYLLKATEGGSYQVTEVSDGNSCIGSGVGIAEITVDPAPEVSILDLDTIHPVSKLTVEFFVEPEGGDFSLSDQPSTIFVNPDSIVYSPAFAGVPNSPHRVIYSYQDPETGCFGRDTVLVYVIEEGGEIKVKNENEKPESYCFNQDTLILQGFNQELKVGQFSINGNEDALYDPDTTDNEAFLIPSKIRSGARTVTYSFNLSSGPLSVKRDFYFEEVTADFTWDHECFTDTTIVKFSDQSLSIGGILDSLKWEIWFPDHVVREAASELDVLFGERDTYSIKHVAISESGCSDTAIKPLVLKPTYPIHEETYYEDFADGSSDWTADSSIGSPNSWTFGVPAGNTIVDPSGNAWYTHIKNYLQEEKSYVISPCFDLSDTERPMIKMDIWQDFVENVDGANIQFQTTERKTWFNLGAIDEGQNWFNSNTILGIPGGNGTGWTDSIHYWRTAKHKLDNIPTNEGPVRFRVTYGVPSQGSIPRDGFVFDNIWIGERTKKVLIEHFTNMGIDTTIKEINSKFNQVINKMNNDVIDIQYHMDRPFSQDTFYLLNSQAANSRDWYYSLPNIPFAIIDGGLNNDDKLLVNFQNEKLEESDLDKVVLEDNKFDIEVTPTKNGDHVDIDIKVTSLENFGQRPMTVHVVIIERLINDVVSDYGETEFESVARDMLPSASGTPYNISWSRGTYRELSLGYDFNGIFDDDEVRIVVFVQDNATREVYQAEMVPADPSVGIGDEITGEFDAFLVYPNPARRYANLEFTEPLTEGSQAQIIDHSGRIISILEMDSGERIQTINLGNYYPGIYIVRVVTDDEIIGTQKLLILGNN